MRTNHPSYSRNNLPLAAAQAMRWIRRRKPVLPIQMKSKRPAVAHGLHAASRKRLKLLRYAEEHPRSNYGLATGRASDLVVLDVDGPNGEASLRKLELKHGAFPETVEVRTAKGRHIYFELDGHPARSSVSRLGPGLDVRGDGSYVIIAGSVHPNGHRYAYAPGHSLDDLAKPASAPAWFIAAVNRRPNSGQAVAPPAPSVEFTSKRSKAYTVAAVAGELNRLKTTRPGRRNTALNAAAFRIGQLGRMSGLDLGVARAELSEVGRAIGLQSDEIAKTIESGLRAGVAQPRSLPQPMATPDELPRLGPISSADDILAAELATLGETEADNGRRFARRFRDEVAYVLGRGLLVWNGKIWEPAADTAALRRAEASAHAITNEAAYLNDGKLKAGREAFSKASLSKAALERAIFLARGHLEASLTRFDAELYLLSVANGTLDLRTGKLGPHDPAHCLTRLTPIVYDRNARCPAFERFLRQRLGHEPELIPYLQKAVGLTLTGAVSEQVLFFLHGDGRTGKSTFVNLIRELLGSFAVHTPVESFTTKQFETIRTDLARMAGARMVTAGEIHPSQQFDEAAIKGLTGGDPITARFMRQDLFQYMPQFKLWLYANHFPKVRATDNAFWRRIRVLPFISVVPEGKVKQNLPELLRAELPGILNWALVGCLAWQREGLEPPDVVRAATEAWRHGADHVSRYLRERTKPMGGARVGAAEMLADFGAWCTAAGEQPVSPAAFKERLTALGRVSRKTNKGRVWIGLRLRG